MKAIEDNDRKEVATQLAPRLFHKQVAIDTKDADGNTPLCKACMGAKDDIVRLLLFPPGNKWKKADVNMRNTNGDTPLTLLLKSVERHTSTLSDYYEHVAKCFAALMEASASIDMTDKNGKTPLMLSVHCLGKGYGDEKTSISYICHTLLELTTSINAVTTANTTFLSFLSAVPSLGDEEYMPLLRRLHEKGEVLVTNKHTNTLQTPLHIATSYQKEKLIEFLITKGADVNALDYLNNTPLMYIDTTPTSDALVTRLCNTLIDLGASVRTINKEGIDFIYKVCNFTRNTRSGYTIVLALLTRSDNGTLAASTAFTASTASTAEKEVIDVNYTYPEGTLLMSACSKPELPKGLELFNELLKRHADINAKNRLGETALIKIIQSMARLQSTGEPAATCLHTLLEMKADITGALQAAATDHFRNFPLIDVLLDMGADPNIKVRLPHDTSSFLQYMIDSTRHTFYLKPFSDLELKALMNTILFKTIPKITDINSKDHIYSGGSPLIYACIDKNTELVQAFLDKGIDLNTISLFRSSSLPEIPYQTPLMLACGDYQNEGIVKLLLEKGADPNFGPTYGNGDSRALWALYYTKPFNMAILQLLVQHNVNINTINSYGLPFIHALCIPRRGLTSDMLLSIIQYLVEHSNVDINITNKNKYNLFHTVLIDTPDIPLLRLLFKYINKDYTINTLLQSKPVIFIVLQEAPALLVECIQELKNVNITYNSSTLLDTCIYKNLPDAVLALLKKNATMSSSTIEYTITKMNPIPLELLHKIPDIHIELSSSKSILAEIITRSPVLDNYMDAITTVLQLGFDVNKKDSSGKTALMYSVNISNLPITITLLEHSSSITAFDNNKNTILYYLFTAKQSNDMLEVCNVLLQEIFKLNDEELFIFLISAHLNKTLGTYFNINGREYLVTPIKKFISSESLRRRFTKDQLVQICVRANHYELLSELLNSEPRPFIDYIVYTYKDRSLQNPLLLSALLNFKEVLQVLVEKTIHINVCSDGNYTALMLAIRNTNMSSIKILIDAGADLRIKTDDGHTALTIALDTENQAIIHYIKKAYEKYVTGERLWSGMSLGDIQVYTNILEASATVEPIGIDKQLLGTHTLINASYCPTCLGTIDHKDQCLHLQMVCPDSTDNYSLNLFNKYKKPGKRPTDTIHWCHLCNHVLQSDAASHYHVDPVRAADPWPPGHQPRRDLLHYEADGSIPYADIACLRAGGNGIYEKVLRYKGLLDAFIEFQDPKYINNPSYTYTNIWTAITERAWDTVIPTDLTVLSKEAIPYIKARSFYPAGHLEKIFPLKNPDVFIPVQLAPMPQVRNKAARNDILKNNLVTQILVQTKPPTYDNSTIGGDEYTSYISLHHRAGRYSDPTISYNYTNPARIKHHTHEANELIGDTVFVDYDPTGKLDPTCLFVSLMDIEDKLFGECPFKQNGCSAIIHPDDMLPIVAAGILKPVDYIIYRTRFDEYYSKKVFAGGAKRRLHMTHNRKKKA